MLSLTVRDARWEGFQILVTYTKKSLKTPIINRRYTTTHIFLSKWPRQILSVSRIPYLFSLVQSLRTRVWRARFRIWIMCSSCILLRHACTLNHNVSRLKTFLLSPCPSHFLPYDWPIIVHDLSGSSRFLAIRLRSFLLEHWDVDPYGKTAHIPLYTWSGP